MSLRIIATLTSLIALAAVAALVLRDSAGAAPTTFTVTKITDTADGTCDADCSLREAIIAANANPGADTITLPAGTYNLTIGGAGENASATGDLDITDDVTINGGGAATTIVDADDLDRVVSVFSGVVNITGVTLRNGTSDYGGGVYVQAGTLNLANVTVSDNYAYGFAGGINNTGTLTLTNSLVTTNVAPNQTGGILNNFGTMTVTNSTVSANTAGTGPGGIYNFNGANLTITNSTIYNNTGGSGGIENGSGTVNISNSTISGNKARGGGGGIYAGSDVTLDHVTITSNTADSDANASGDGGGIAAYATVNSRNSIIAGNIDLSSEPDCVGTITSGGYNLIETVSPGCTITGDTATNVTGQSANLGPIAGNGGPTLTHALLAGSPAIDFGSADCPPPATDQRGVTRPKGNRCDIGAYESNFSGPTPEPTPSPTPSPSPTPTPTPTTGPSETPSTTPTTTPTPTPSNEPSVTPSFGPTATPTPTATPEGPLQGDVDCSQHVDSVDALKELRHIAGLSVSQDQPCPGIGEGSPKFGDVDCDGAVSAVDALKVLRFIAGLGVSQTEPCKDIGTRG